MAATPLPNVNHLYRERPSRDSVTHPVPVFLASCHYLKAMSLWDLWEQEGQPDPHSKDRGQGEGPAVAWVQLTSQLAVTSS